MIGFDRSTLCVLLDTAIGAKIKLEKGQPLDETDETRLTVSGILVSKSREERIEELERFISKAAAELK